MGGWGGWVNRTSVVRAPKGESHPGEEGDERTEEGGEHGGKDGGA